MNRDWIPTVAGIFEIVAAVCALIGAASLLFAALVITSVPDIQNDPDVPVDLISGLLGAIAIFVLVGGVVALVGGIAGVRRQGWGRAVAGAIAAVFLMPPVGILALVMTIVGEKEFRERRMAAAEEGV
jgi:hypothetical protein